VLPFQNMSGDPEQEYFAERHHHCAFPATHSRIWSLWAVGAFWRRSLAPCLDDADRLRAAARGRPSRCRGRSGNRGLRRNCPRRCEGSARRERIFGSEGG
jgi:hypothetical protein